MNTVYETQRTTIFFNILTETWTKVTTQKAALAFKHPIISQILQKITLRVVKK